MIRSLPIFLFFLTAGVRAETGTTFVSNRILCRAILKSLSIYLGKDTSEENTRAALDQLKSFRLLLPGREEIEKFDDETHSIFNHSKLKTSSDDYLGGVVLNQKKTENLLENIEKLKMEQYKNCAPFKYVLWLVRAGLIFFPAISFYGHAPIAGILLSIFEATTVYPEFSKYLQLYDPSTQKHLQNLRTEKTMPDWSFFKLVEKQHHDDIPDTLDPKSKSAIDFGQRFVDGISDWSVQSLSYAIQKLFHFLRIQPEVNPLLQKVQIKFFWQKREGSLEDKLIVFVQTYRKMPPPRRGKRKLSLLERLKLGLAPIPHPN